MNVSFSELFDTRCLKKYPLKPVEWLAWLVLIGLPIFSGIVLMVFFSVLLLEQEGWFPRLMGGAFALLASLFFIRAFTSGKRRVWLVINGKSSIATVVAVNHKSTSPTGGSVGNADYEYIDSNAVLHRGTYSISKLFFFLPYKEKLNATREVFYNPNDPSDSIVVEPNIFSLLDKVIRSLYKPQTEEKRS